QNFNGAKLKIFHARSDQVEAKLREVRQQAGNMKIDLVLAILPNKNGSLYGDIKRICETDIGLMSQCCLLKNVEKSSPQFLANVALKINAKCGGRNSVFADIPVSLPVVWKQPTIIFGADVTHPSALDDTAPSIASVVASQDWPEVTKYHGDVHAQGHRVELIEALEGIVKKLLLSFEKQSKQRPKQLIFYRDGVSEGQFRKVLEDEIPLIEKAWKALYNEKPSITFIVVQKRHHTRLFPSDGKYQDNSGNVMPGYFTNRISKMSDFYEMCFSHVAVKLQAQLLIGRSATQQSLISSSVAMLGSREQAVLHITTCCEMTTTSVLMTCSLLQTTYATRMQAALARCRLLLLHITLISLRSVRDST
uniref:Piwi domain-containing protein n=1 Tax=Aegilops tauschii subsp. strangulata TaxID=200361 RepID=A0A453E8C8_AEGTS